MSDFNQKFVTFSSIRQSLGTLRYRSEQFFGVVVLSPVKDIISAASFTNSAVAHDEYFICDACDNTEVMTNENYRYISRFL